MVVTIPVALGIFTCAMGLGLDLARRALRGRPAPLIYGLSHAAMAVAGVVTLGVGVFGGPTGKLVNSALLFFLLALVGGLFLLVFRIQREPPPMAVVYLHASGALLAWGLLLVGLLR